MEASQKRRDSPRKQLDLEAYISFEQRAIDCGEVTRQRKERFGLLRVENYGDINI